MTKRVRLVKISLVHYHNTKKMLTYLPNYSALIQLLIGSVCISMLFQKNNPFKYLWDCFEQELRDRIGLPNEYELVSYSYWRKNLLSLRKSIMVALAIYGCMVLFYCANFPNEYTTVPLSITLYNSTIIPIRNDFLSSIPSPLGIFILSLIIFLYQLIAIIKPSTKIHSTNIFFICIIISLLIAFIVFIIVIPELDLNSFCSIEDQWENKWKKKWILAVNIIVLINLILWIGLYIRLYCTNANNLIYDIQIDILVLSQFGIQNRLNYIMEKLETDYPIRSHKKHLIKRALKELQKDKTYFIETNGILTMPTNLQENLKNTIKSSQQLTNFQKRRLVKAIRKNPKADPSYSDNNQILINIEIEKEEAIRKNANKLCRLGFLKKTESYKTWWQRAFS